MNFKTSSLIKLLTLIGTALACSKQSNKNESNQLQSQNFDLQTGDFAHCGQILVNGIYNDQNLKSDYHSKTFLINNACETLDTYSDIGDDQWSKECNTSSSRSGGNLGVDAVIKTIPIGLDAGYQQGSSDSYCKDAGTRRAYRKTWYEHMCKSDQQSSQINANRNQVLKSIDQGVVNAWKECISEQRYKGLTCSAKNAGSGFNIDIDYDPDALAPDKLSLTFQYSGATPIGNLPNTMGRGNVTEVFKFDDWTQPINVVVTGSSSSGGQVSCSVQLPSQEPRICQDGNLVGTLSKNVYEINDPVCKRIDQCEIGRLKAVFNGKIGWEDYLELAAENWGVFFGKNGAMAQGPCTL